MNLLLTELAEAHELEKPPPTDGNGAYFYCAKCSPPIYWKRSNLLHSSIISQHPLLYRSLFSSIDPELVL
jgi:hypothetical protein